MSGLGPLGSLGRGSLGPADTDDELRCSRAGCRSTATLAVNWRNPKIHAEDRVKVWLACDEHGEYLRDYLATRGFPVLVGAIGDTVVLPASAAQQQGATS